MAGLPEDLHLELDPEVQDPEVLPGLLTGLRTVLSTPPVRADPPGPLLRDLQSDRSTADLS